VVGAGYWHNRAHDDELPLTLDNKQKLSTERDNDLLPAPFRFPFSLFSTQEVDESAGRRQATNFLRKNKTL